MTLTIKNLSIRYENVEDRMRSTTPIRSLSIDLLHGQIVSILGPSGCGKTTLLLSLADLLDGRLVSASHDGILIREQSPSVIRQAHNLSFVFQKPIFFEWMTVLQSIYSHCRIANKTASPTLITSLAEKLHLRPHMSKFPSELSGGLLSRAALLRALATSPAYLFLDEPFSGLDEILRGSILRTLFSHIRRNDIFTILVTHNVDEAVRISDQVVLLRNEGQTSIITYDVGQHLSDGDRFSDGEPISALSARIRKDFANVTGETHD